MPQGFFPCGIQTKNYIYMIKKILTLGIILGIAASCVDPDDLVTSDAKEGGLLVAVDEELSYVSGAQIDILVVPTSGITEINFYKSYSKDGEMTTEVLDKTVPVTAGAEEVGYTLDYNALKSGLTGFPDSDTELNVGDFWQFRITSKLSDGRLVESAFTIKAIVDNPYSGDYKSVGKIKRETAPGVFVENAYEDEKALSTIDANTCETLGAYGWFNNPAILFRLAVNDDNTVTILESPDSDVAITATPGKVSTYDPDKKEFTLYYQYVNASALSRVIEETVTRVE
jgi:hypothetical protein